MVEFKKVVVLPSTPASSLAVVSLRQGLYVSGATPQVDDPDYPTDDLWVQNPGNMDNAEVTLIGATWAPTDTSVAWWFRFWRRFSDIAPVGAPAHSFAALAKYAVTLSDVGTPVYDSDSVIDAGQDFHMVQPLVGSPSLYIITAQPAANTNPAFFGFAGPDTIHPALLVKKGQLADATVGWLGGTPGGTVATYSVRRPNLMHSYILKDLAGADLAATLSQVDGLGGGGAACADLAVRFF